MFLPYILVNDEQVPSLDPNRQLRFNIYGDEFNPVGIRLFTTLFV